MAIHFCSPRSDETDAKFQLVNLGSEQADIGELPDGADRRIGACAGEERAGAAREPRAALVGADPAAAAHCASG